MLNRLSEYYQKEIALTLICIFFIGGFTSLRVQAMVYPNTDYVHYSNLNSNNKLSIVSRNELLSTKTLEKWEMQPNWEQSKYFQNQQSVNATFEDSMNAHPTRSLISTKKISLKQSKLSLVSDIGGPGQPEMSSFKPVGSDNMVSPFTGDFSYNIPLLDVGGYPVNMFYNSGITMDQEASWVGLGWNINPGTINRNMRGIPDDFDGTDKIIERQSVRPDETWGVSGGVGLKFAGVPLVSSSINVSLGLSFNNKLGVAAQAGIHPALSISSNSTDGQTSGLSYGATVGTALNLSSRNGASLTPSISFDISNSGDKFGYGASLGAGYTYSSRLGLEAMHLNAGLSFSKRNAFEHHNNKTGKTTSITGRVSYALNSSISYAYPTVLPSITNIYTRKSYNLSFGVGMELWALNPHARIAGFYTESTIADEDKITSHPAYGYLHYQDAEKDDNAMLDFNRINDGVYTPSNPAIALPIYTYDIFSITGEGTGGSFRAYRGDMGYMRDALVTTKDDGLSVGLDVGFPSIIHGGGEFTKAYSPTTVSAWKENNAVASVLKFQENRGNFQSVYFKNPGEKTIPDENFQNAIGGENLVRFKMANKESGTPLLLPTIIKYDGNQNVIGEQQLKGNDFVKNKRDKRTQVITFLTAKEADRIGFDKKIYSYSPDTTKVIFSANCNSIGIDTIERINESNYRKAHHISEIDVLGADGRKYVYGLPVYNTRQVDVSFSIESGDAVTGKTSYDPGIDDEVKMEDSDGNMNGRDWYVKQEETPAYTHSFLLTELVSPNFVDVTGNGISDDDMGDAVKFNYSQFSNIHWRTPVEENIATYNQGLKTDPKDDKAHYIYGTREMWLLYSIESKNMVARFYAKNDRKDGKEVLGQAGGVNPDWGTQRLDKICLYSKGDLVKYGDGAKPIKTIKFFQSYKLCQGMANNLSGTGKLTLDSIWITYNGNTRKANNRFIFSYPEENNPDYEFNSNDRWGNYKSMTANPAGMQNTDYPYTIQDQVKTDKFVAAWTMNKIILPSGAAITVNYESDDYAYVQDKKAASMHQIIGFGTNTQPDLSSSNINALYNGAMDNDFIYIQLPYPIKDGTPTEKQRELAARYFEDTKQLYMKLAVIMPSGRNIAGLEGSETIAVYADIESFGLIDSANGLSSTVAWVKVKKLENLVTPMTQESFQFLKEQLPGKAFKNYDLSETSGMKAIVLALGGMLASFKELQIGLDNVLRSASKCRQVETVKSFARLTNPVLKKLGGGLRVKQITVHDNWNKMTGQYESTYGQEYKYTTAELINNKSCIISSGVAAWEPAIGDDENPHKEIKRFLNHNKKGPYDFGATGLPIGEAFYPTPMVGYSKVEILSIHRDTVKNLPTKQVSEFYTTRDFPFKSSFTSLVDPEANVKYEPSPIKQLLHLDMQKAVTLSQGFLVDINDMNGKEKRIETYTSADSISPVFFTQYYYNVEKATDKTFKFNHVFPTISSAEGKITNSIIGRDIELMADFRQHTSQTITTNIHVNFDFFVLGIFPVPLHNLLQPTIYEGMTYRSASLLKIVNHYGILDSVVSVDKGSMVSTKNLVYDAETGNTLLTRTHNEHNQPIYNFTYPAHWAYSGMGPAYKNIDARFEGLNFSHGKLMNMPVEMNSLLESGDELYTLAENNLRIDSVVPCDNNAGDDPWTTLASSDDRKIWAVNTGKANSTNPQWIFINREGNPYNAVQASVRIVRSGHRNMLGQSVASITTMQNPIDISGQLKFNDAANIIQTSAATFKDHWKVDNSFYLVDSLVRVDVPVQVRKLSLNPLSTLNVGLYHCISPSDNTASAIFNQNYFIAEARSRGRRNDQSKHYLVSFAKYDLNTLPGDATVILAKLSLASHHYDNLPLNSSLSHNFPVIECNNHSIANHLNSESHDNEQRHDWNNAFKFTRMTKDWNNINTPDLWRDYVVNQNYNGSEVAVSHPPVPTFPQVTSYQSFISVYNNKLGCVDDRIDVTSIVDKMASERNLSPIIKMELVKNNGYQLNKNDFYPIGGSDDRPVRVCFQPPTLDVYYYSCSEDNSQTLLGQSVSPNATIPSCDPDFPPYYCTTWQHRPFCFSKFTQKKSINPYVEGILGNWRVDTSYIYYGDRKETNPNIDIDTRTAGTIVNYKNFWNFSASEGGYLSRNTLANNEWVWNATITQYNRKGYEIENKDPLGRFNSGLYGYNQQLPIAVANNARVREVLFDGFEDYDYNTAQNCITCKPRRSFNYDQEILAALDSTQNHSGLKSLKIDAGQSISINAPITNTFIADRGFGLRMRIDSTRFIDTLVTGRGTGLRGNYLNYYDFPSIFRCAPSNDLECIADELDGPYDLTRNDANINFQWNLSSIAPPTINKNYFAVRWNGYYQATSTGYHYFLTKSDDGVRLRVNGSQIINNWTKHSLTDDASTPIWFQKGKTYTIQLDYFDGKRQNGIMLFYKSPEMQDAGQDFDLIPTNQLYLPDHISDTAGTVVINQSQWCTRLDSINVRENALTDTFSLLNNKKMLISAWVKEGGNDCKCSSYVKNNIAISYDGASADATFYPSGSIIEGWQRYESVFTIPANATSVKITMNNNTQNDPVYFDDIRIQPFNANMKSFVYNSSNLRLMSELDGNNYATFYEYDDDGTLIRVKKETQQGIKTITETRSAMQKVMNDE